MSYLIDNDENNDPEKILFMGLAEAGKSTISSVVFQGHNPKDLIEYNPTVNFNRVYKPFFQGYPKNSVQILDTGGQESFFPIFFGKNEEFIFSNVKYLIWVIDGINYDKRANQNLLEKSIKSLTKFSPNALIFCFMHKADLMDRDFSDMIFQTIIQDLSFEGGKLLRFYKTSVYDDSIIRIFEEII